MRRLSLSLAALALSLFSVGLAPQHADAAPLPAAYSGSAGGDLVAVDLDVTNGPNLVGARLAVAQSTMSGGTTPTATASVSNLGAALTALGIAVQSNSQTAPPDHPSPDTGMLVGAASPGLFDLGLLNTLVQARSQAAIACSPGGGIMANSFVQTAGAILSPAGVGTVVDTGDSTTSGVLSIIPEPQGDPVNRGLLSSATGNISTNTFLNGQVTLAIAGQSVLQAFASGVPGGANTTYSPGTVTVSVGSTNTTVAVGDSATFDLPNGQVVITVNQPTITEAPNGQTATASVAVVTADVRVGPANAPQATASMDILPLRASAVAPPGGIDCPPPAPVLNLPANGATLTDTTPTFTGTAYPGADVDILIGGNPIGTTTANSGGNFSFTPGTPLSSGFHLATARQTTPGGTSPESSANGITIFGPPILDTPADSTVTNDTTPTFAGLTMPNVQVDIRVDGNVISTTTADSTGHFSFTPGTALSPGGHQASARARMSTLISDISNVNDFTIDLAPPPAPTLNRPADGSVTRDTTPAFTGKAEPGAAVEIFVDGASIGTTTANGSGNFSFTPSTPLPVGTHEAYVGATDRAGNDSPPSNTNGFSIDTVDPDAPGISSPGDGSTTTDRTPTITGTAEPGSHVIIYIDGEQVGSTTADENGNFSFTLPDALALGDHELSAVAVDEAGNRSDASDPITFGVLAAEANAGGGQHNQLGQTGGVGGWLPITGALGVLAGTGILGLTRWRRRNSQA